MLAAPALVTIAVIAVSLVIAAGHSGDKPGPSQRPAPVSSSSPSAATLKDGWYTVRAITGAPSAYCLAAVRDNQNQPILAQLKCDDHDRTQRVRLESTSGTTYKVEIRLGPNEPACATLDSTDTGARLHMNGCATGTRLQSFTLTSTGPGVVQLKPLATGMCLGVDNSSPTTLYAMQTTCDTPVRGYGFAPAPAPTGR